MKINYSRYTLEELEEARSAIDEDAYPDRVSELDALLYEKANSCQKLNQDETLIEKEFYLCPGCGSQLSQKVVNKLRYLVFGVRASVCDKCNSKIQWTLDVRKKIRVFGYIVNFGLVAGLYALLAWIEILPMFSESFHLVGSSLAAIGISGVISKTKGAKLELVNDITDQSSK